MAILQGARETRGVTAPQKFPWPLYWFPIFQRRDYDYFGGVGWGWVGWGGVKDLYQDAFLLYFILWLFIALSKAFITSFMLAVVLNNKVVISLH